MLVWHLLPENLKNESVNPKFNNAEKVREAFIVHEATTLCTRDRVIDIFKDVKMKKDDFEKLHKQMNNHISYKFMKTKKELIFSRLDIILKSNILQGSQYIITMIQKIKILKELFVLDLE
tara:strand:- start:681 stop:1040 length:360 start_codon:yes stop_codon:yes gene_type:complete